MEDLENITNQLADSHECYYIGDFNIDFSNDMLLPGNRKFKGIQE